MRKLSTVQNGGFPNIFSFHIIHYTLFSSLKNICNKKDFHVARQTCWWKRPFHVGCQDKGGPSKIHEVILVNIRVTNYSLQLSCLQSIVWRTISFCRVLLWYLLHIMISVKVHRVISGTEKSKKIAFLFAKLCCFHYYNINDRIQYNLIEYHFFSVNY